MSFFAYLAGTIGLLLGIALVLIPAVLLQARLLPGWRGPVAWVAVLILAVAVATITSLVLGTIGILHGWTFLVLLALVAGASWYWREPLVNGPQAEGSPGTELAMVPGNRLVPATSPNPGKG